MFSHPVTRIISLHSILVKSIRYAYQNNQYTVLALHSILVKSIPICDSAHLISCRTLHSILVKSILYLFLPNILPCLLYIPFWLNLYQNHWCFSCRVLALHSILVKSIQCDGWLTLSFVDALHSILVKSILIRNHIAINGTYLYIPFWLNLYGTLVSESPLPDLLYIPFWLNLYRFNPYVVAGSITLHSILVKSIPYYFLWLIYD